MLAVFWLAPDAAGVVIVFMPPLWFITEVLSNSKKEKKEKIVAYSVVFWGFPGAAMSDPQLTASTTNVVKGIDINILPVFLSFYYPTTRAHPRQYRARALDLAGLWQLPWRVRVQIRQMTDGHHQLPLGWHGTNVGLGDGVFVEAGGEDLEEDVAAELGEGPVLWRRGSTTQEENGKRKEASGPLEEDGPLARLSMRPCSLTDFFNARMYEYINRGDTQVPANNLNMYIFSGPGSFACILVLIYAVFRFRYSFFMPTIITINPKDFFFFCFVVPTHIHTHKTSRKKGKKKKETIRRKRKKDPRCVREEKGLTRKDKKKGKG
ncbi:hypothetical protein VP01_1272g2 [Puccinia sorghi]|uniref:Uncharacterized protein n=1 Tax=Puccinia sorghi TaxID=27349 RepID=A0A0L6VNY0_9BASI|nr:hypothetical protein VP01_1272g2 [Puccinia sorghi]